MFISRNEYKELLGRIKSTQKELRDFKQEIGNNGVEVAIMDLKGEVFMDKKEFKFGGHSAFEPTLKTKVEGIMAFLGLKIEVESIPATVAGTHTTVTRNEPVDTAAPKKIAKKVTKKTNRKK